MRSTARLVGRISWWGGPFHTSRINENDVELESDIQPIDPGRSSLAQRGGSSYIDGQIQLPDRMASTFG